MESKFSESAEIEIPNELKYILKEYAKNLIRSQPEDLLKWSAEYFRDKYNSENSKISEEIITQGKCSSI
ncbi:hypothetical protein NPIL_587971 [Nephila pilipes]|uniref:RIIa domain-containing protein n=1 Tax=Nephila pilipes TaxID=299642 RepID=A0A8X6URQ7_NEPPI|nr:hypothetical protein NPIL_587971 [Nephila pilipes]